MNSFSSLISCTIIVITIITVNGQLPSWWPFGLTKNKVEHPQEETYQKQLESAAVLDSRNKTNSQQQQLLPLPWIFKGSPNPSESKSWFLEYFQKTLQNFRPPYQISTLPPAPFETVNFQPRKQVVPEINSATNVWNTCNTEKVCSLRLKSYETKDPLFRYSYSHFSNMDPLLQDIFEKSRRSYLDPPLTVDDVMPPEVVTFIMSLMEATESKMALIVGVFTGLSVVAAALATNKDGKILAVENPEYLKYWNQIGNNFVKNSQLSDKIIVQGATRVPQYLDSLAKTQPASFDFIILDDYDLENYKTDYINCFELLRPRGIMLINNVLNNGKVLSGQQYRDFKTKTLDDLNSKLFNDWRVITSLLPIGNGVMLVIKK